MKKKTTLLNPQLEVFVAVAKHKSMHSAAAEIHLSQTAITQRIKSLEHKLRATLFIRTRQGVYLTPDGEALLRYCHAVLDLEGETLANISTAGINSSARICISGPSSIMSSRIIPQCLRVLKKYPMLSITFDVNDSPQRIQSLQIGTSQFVIIEREHILKEMQTKEIKPEKYALVCTPAWKNRSIQDIIQSEKIIDFDEADTMTANYLNYFKLLPLAQSERHFLNKTPALATMFMQGYGYGVLTKEFSKSYLDNKQLITLNAGKTYTHRMLLAWYNRTQPSSYFSDILNAIT